MVLAPPLSERGVAHMREAASVRFLSQASRRHNPRQADASRNLNLELQAISMEMASSRQARNDAARASQAAALGAGGGAPQYSPVVPAGYQGQPAVASPSYPMPQASAQPAYPSPAHAQPSYPASPAGGGGGYPSQGAYSPHQGGGYPSQPAAQPAGSAP